MDCESIEKTLKKVEEDFFKLKEELGIKKSIEDWDNLNISIKKNRGRYSLTLQFIRYKGKNEAVYISSYPLTTPKEEIKQTEEYKKAEKLKHLFKVIKAKRQLETAIKEISNFLKV